VSYYAVRREAGPGWAEGGIAAQRALHEHAAFMKGLVDDGFLLFGGPLSGSEHRRVRALLIVDAESAADIQRRLADDPWAQTEQLVTLSIEPWKILVSASGERALEGGPVERAAVRLEQVLDR
jgi:uncharacterized protein YciI